MKFLFTKEFFFNFIILSKFGKLFKDTLPNKNYSKSEKCYNYTFFYKNIYFFFNF